MFVIYHLKDTVEVDSELLGTSFKDAVILKLEQKYIGKVLQNEGIGVVLYELNIHENKIKSDMILAHTHFSLILFQPFPGEVLTGRILSSNHEGITVSLEFIEAFIPAACLAQPSSYDEMEKVFVWHYQGNDLFYDEGEVIRFKVYSFTLPEEDGETAQLIVNLT